MAAGENPPKPEIYLAHRELIEGAHRPHRLHEPLAPFLERLGYQSVRVIEHPDYGSVRWMRLDVRCSSHMARVGHAPVVTTRASNWLSGDLMSRVIVSAVTSVGPEAEGPTAPGWVFVRLDQEPGQKFRLPSEAGGLQKRMRLAATLFKRPVYVTVENDVVQDVDLAIVGRVSRFEPKPDGSHRVGLDASARLLRVDAETAASASLAAAGDKIMMVRVDRTGRIIEATKALPESEHLAPVFDALGLQPRSELDATNVTMARANALFDRLLEGRCGVENEQTCIPFDYPDSGCEARAHEICRRLLRSAVVAGKLWVFPPMRIHTRTFQSGCFIGWWFHVSPFVNVAGTDHVLDPTLFDRPVALPEFVNAMNADAASVHFSARDVYQVTATTGRGSRARRDDVRVTLEDCRISARERSPQPPYCP